MGVVARHIYDHYIYPTSTGAFQISYYPTEGTAWRAHKEMEEAYPLEIEQGRIRASFIYLNALIIRSQADPSPYGFTAWLI